MNVFAVNSNSSQWRVLFFFIDTATTEIYTLSLHDALPIYSAVELRGGVIDHEARSVDLHRRVDRKSTRLNSSHGSISYAVFCLKKNNRNRLRAVLYLDESQNIQFGIWRD